MKNLMFPQLKQNNAGSVIVISLVVITTVFVIVGSILKMSINESWHTNRSYTSMSALNVAEAGVEAALYEMNYSDADFKASGNVGGWSGTDPRKKDLADLTSGSSTIGQYEISVDDPTDSHPTVNVTAYVPSKSLPKSTRTVSAKLSQQTGIQFDWAVAGHHDVDINGATVDSYNSNNGLYNETTNVGTKGFVGTNGTSSGDLLVRSGSTINGTLQSGFGSNPITAISVVSGATYNGVLIDSPYNGPAKQALTEPIDFTSIAAPADIAALPTTNFINTGSGVVSVIPPGIGKYSLIKQGSNGKLKFTGDTTIFVDDLDIYGTTGSTDSAQIIVENNAKVKIYVGHSMSIGSKTKVNENGKPGNFTIEATDSFTGYATSGIRVLGGSTFYGTIKAKNAGIEIGTDTEVFGGLMGERIILRSGSKVHYDEALMQPPDDSTAEYALVTWIEK